jgi:SAM-dependent methyltransferase
MDSEILAHYDGADEAGRLTASTGRLELLRTQEVIRRHLPTGPLQIADIGGGAGIHAAWLAADGHHVHLLDPVPKHVTQTAALVPSGGSITARVGHAADVPLHDASVDAVLLLGPLYHLTERADRVQALSEAARIVRPGGPVFAAAVSRFASLFDGLAGGHLTDPEFRRIVEADLATGQHRNPTNHPDWFTTAYFHHPDELGQEASDAGLTVDSVLGIEGPAAWHASVNESWDDEPVREAALFAARAVEAEPTLLALSPHLLLVAHRPR